MTKPHETHPKPHGKPHDVPEESPLGVGAKAQGDTSKGGPVPRGDDAPNEQPAREPKDEIVAGAWTTPPPGQLPPGDRPPPGLPEESTDPNRVPRVINPNLRASEGFTRFKIRADLTGSGSKTLYILAKKDDEDGARTCYLKATGLDRKRKSLNAEGKVVEEVQAVDLMVKKLPD